MVALGERAAREGPARGGTGRGGRPGRGRVLGRPRPAQVPRPRPTQVQAALDGRGAVRREDEVVWVAAAALVRGGRRRV